MKNYIQMFKTSQLLSLVIISESMADNVEVNNESPEVNQKDYDSYYLNSEKLKFFHRTDDKLDEPKITFLDVFWPFILTFWWTFFVITVILVILVCICVLQAVDWPTLCKPLEYFPCQNHSALSRRLERLKTPGVYIRKNGIKDYYKPIANESEIANDIYERLQT